MSTVHNEPLLTESHCMHALGITSDTQSKCSGNTAATTCAPTAGTVFHGACNSRLERLQQSRLEAPARKLAAEVTTHARVHEQRGSRHLLMKSTLHRGPSSRDSLLSPVSSIQHHTRCPRTRHLQSSTLSFSCTTSSISLM